MKPLSRSLWGAVLWECLLGPAAQATPEHGKLPAPAVGQPSRPEAGQSSAIPGPAGLAIDWVRFLRPDRGLYAARGVQGRATGPAHGALERSHLRTFGNGLPEVVYCLPLALNAAGLLRFCLKKRELAPGSKAKQSAARRIAYPSSVGKHRDGRLRKKCARRHQRYPIPIRISYRSEAGKFTFGSPCDTRDLWRGG